MKVLRGVEPVLRREFADVCAEVGPDAPTLCDGWTTRDLVIHMVLIEGRWDSWFGVMLGKRSRIVRDYYDRLVDRERSREWTALVDRIRTGPRFTPLRSQRVRDRMMPREYLIHTEDVRRANGIDVAVSAEAQDVAWTRLPGLAKRFLLTAAPYGLHLRRPDGSTMVIASGTPIATLEGEPLELLLHVFGRTAGTRVELTGDPDAIAAVHVRDTGKAAEALPRVAGTS